MKRKIKIINVIITFIPVKNTPPAGIYKKKYSNTLICYKNKIIAVDFIYNTETADQTADQFLISHKSNTSSLVFLCYSFQQV